MNEFRFSKDEETIVEFDNNSVSLDVKNSFNKNGLKVYKIPFNKIEKSYLKDINLDDFKKAIYFIDHNNTIYIADTATFSIIPNTRIYVVFKIIVNKNKNKKEKKEDENK